MQLTSARTLDQQRQQYPNQVAWLKEETKTILSIDTNIIITNYRIFLIPDEEGRKWVLHIKDVQESDRVSRWGLHLDRNPHSSDRSLAK